MNETAKRILEAAVEEFSQYGYDGARLSRIAQRAQVHTAQIHYYYRNKEELFSEVQKAMQPPQTEHILTVLIQPGLSMPERIQWFYERFGAFVQALSLPADGSGFVAHLVPPLLRGPKALALPAWEETLRQAQQFGMVRPLPIGLVLAHQWSVAMMPLWFIPDRASWPSYYQSEAAAYFWSLAKNIP